MVTETVTIRESRIASKVMQILAVCIDGKWRETFLRHASILPICQIGNTVSMMKTISLKLPVPLANWLARRANELGRSRSDLVRQALKEQRQGKNARGEKSCAELMGEFGGFFRGPRDLSTNSKYMRDFGK